MHLTTFDFNEAPVRVMLQDEQPWFVAADVCRVLEIAKRPAFALRATAGKPRLGRGLGALLLRRNLARAGALAPLLREPALPRGMPAWARGFYLKVWRLGRKA